MPFSTEFRDRGAVLILVLIVFSGLSLMAFGLTHRVRLDLKAEQYRAEQLQAYHLALAGIRRAAVELEADANEIDHRAEPWALRTSLSAEGFFAAEQGGIAGGDAQYAVSDEEGRLNVNVTSPAGWLKLPGVTREVVDAILDWQDEDDQPSAQGAESPAYRQLVEPCVAKNADLMMVCELACVMNVTHRLLTGEDGNGNGLLEANEDDGLATWPADDADGRLDFGLLDYFTTYGDGKVNLNTATREVLGALPGLSKQAPEAVVDYRDGPNRLPGDLDDRPFTKIEDLLEVPGLREVDVSVLSEVGRLTSDHFRITCEGRSRHGATCRLVAALRRAKGKVQIVVVRRL